MATQATSRKADRQSTASIMSDQKLMIVRLSAQRASFFHDDELAQTLRRQSTIAVPPVTLL